MITEADSQYSSLDMVSIIGPVPTIDIIKPFERCITGCNRRCPCRTWINCGYYNNARWKELRGDEEAIWTEIHEWYENFFKCKPGLPDATYPNG